MKLLFTILLIANLAQAASSNTKMMTCRLDVDQGGGIADISVNDGGWVSLSAQAKGESFLHLAFTRTFAELNVIEPTDHVMAVSYFDSTKNCTTGVDTRDVNCNRKLGQVALVVQRRDKNGTTLEKKFTVQFDNVEIKSQRTDEGAAWMWEFVKDGKWAYTNSLSLSACEYGQQHWAD